VLLFKYLQNHLNLNVNGKNQTIKYLGYEMESEACWIYLQSSCLEAPKTIMVENSILYDSQIKQSNIVQVEIDENKQSAKLSYPDKHLIFNF